MSERLHEQRFPGESEEYRDARDELLKAEVEEWKHGSWYHSVTLRAMNLEDLMEKLKAETSTQPFAKTHDSSFPNRPFWSGGLAYDCLLYTSPSPRDS